MNDTLLLKPPRTQDPLDGTEGELRRLTRHLLTLVVRYRGRVSLPRNRKPFERRWQVGINGDMHTIAHDLGPRGEWSRGGVVITDGLGRVRSYEVLLKRGASDKLAGDRAAQRARGAGRSHQIEQKQNARLEFHDSVIILLTSSRYRDTM